MEYPHLLLVLASMHSVFFPFFSLWWKPSFSFLVWLSSVRSTKFIRQFLLVTQHVSVLMYTTEETNHHQCPPTHISLSSCMDGTTSLKQNSTLLIVLFTPFFSVALITFHTTTSWKPHHSSSEHRCICWYYEDSCPH